MPDKTTVAGEFPNPAVIFRDGDFLRTGVPHIAQGDRLFTAGQMCAYATAALAQKDGEIERLREALRRLLDAENDAHLTIQGVRNLARAALGSQA